MATGSMPIKEPRDWTMGTTQSSSVNWTDTITVDHIHAPAFVRPEPWGTPRYTPFSVQDAQTLISVASYELYALRQIVAALREKYLKDELDPAVRRLVGEYDLAIGGSLKHEREVIEQLQALLDDLEARVDN